MGKVVGLSDRRTAAKTADQSTSVPNVSPPSRASPLPQLDRVHPQKQVAVRRPRSRSRDRSLRPLLQWVSVHPREIGWLAGRLRWQASSYNGSVYTSALHHSSGRALARLQRLILIHPPLREAEWRCSSGEWRAAPFDAVEHAACRSSRSRPEGSVPGWTPERRNPEP